MPDLAGLLLRRSLGSLGSAGGRCATCHRTPLAGARLHELDTGRKLCDLCFAALPEPERVAVRSERVHASERHVAGSPKAA